MLVSLIFFYELKSAFCIAVISRRRVSHSESSRLPTMLRTRMKYRDKLLSKSTADGAMHRESVIYAIGEEPAAHLYLCQVIGT
jgi:hypothetical protein